MNYPVSNNSSQVIKEFQSYIGLGHEEITEEKSQSKFNMEQEKSSAEKEMERIRIEMENARNHQGGSTSNVTKTITEQRTVNGQTVTETRTING